MQTVQNQAPPAINPKLIVPFVNSVKAVFATMLGVRTTVARPMLKTQNAPAYDISSIIGFSGEVIGSVAVSYHQDVALKLVEAFTGSAIAPGSPDFVDAVGELANMIAGSAKKDLGAAASISVPSVIIGHGHSIAHLRGVPCLIIPCSTPAGDFAVEDNIKQVAPGEVV